MTGNAVPRIAVWKLASCDGCQLTVLDLSDELLTLAGQAEIAHFTEATSTDTPGQYDISLVEGSVSTPACRSLITRIRERSQVVVTIGACATAGGIQALRNFGDVAEFAAAVYARPDYIETLATSTPVAAHISVDFELRGCPIDRRQLLELLSALLAGRKPRIPGHSVCYECKLRGTACIMVADGIPCLGPVTQAGCGAICPALQRGCYGCFGPMATPDTAALAPVLSRAGMSGAAAERVYQTFNAASDAFLHAARQAATGPDQPERHPPAGRPTPPPAD